MKKLLALLLVLTMMLSMLAACGSSSSSSDTDTAEETTETTEEEAEEAEEAEEEEEEEEATTTTDTSSSSSSSSSSSYNASYASTVIARAYSCIGLPYVYGASGPSSFDCSGFVSYCLTGVYAHLTTAAGFYYCSISGLTVVPDPQPGDICCTTTHCGIYIGDGLMIHSPQSGKTITVASVRSGMRYVRYSG